MSKVFIIDNFAGGLKYGNRWELTAEVIREWGFEVEIIKSQKTNQSEVFEFLDLASLSKNLSFKLFHKQIKNGDIVIFPKARDMLALMLHEHRVLHNLNIFMIGYWLDGVYYSDGRMRNAQLVKNLGWSNYFEKALVNSYDYNIVTNKDYLERFKNRYAISTTKPIVFGSLPFAYRKDLLLKYMGIPEIVKDDLIIMNTTNESEWSDKALGIFKNEYENFKFVELNDYNFNAPEYYRLLSKAKVLISTNTYDIKPYMVYEAMALGVAPALPDIPIYKEMYNSMWLYDKTITKPPFLNFIRSREVVFERVNTFLENDTQAILKEHVKKLEETYFNIDELKELINNYTKRLSNV